MPETDTIDPSTVAGAQAPPAASALSGWGGQPAASAQAPAQSLDSMLTPPPELKGLAQQKLKADEKSAVELEQKSNEDRARMQKYFAAEGASADDIKTWNADEELDKRRHSPMEQFGSAASIFSIAASAFTHMPATNAMNAMAAGMNAMQKGDMDAYDKAFDAFKENSALAIKRQQMQHQMYEDAHKFFETDLTTMRAKAVATAAQFDDKKALVFLNNGMDKEYFELQASRVASEAKMSKARMEMVENDTKMRVLNADPDWKSGDPRRMSTAIKRVEQGQLTPEQEFISKWTTEHPEGSSKELSDAFGEFRRGQLRPYGSAAGGAPTRERAILNRTVEIMDENPDMTKREAEDQAAKEIVKSRTPDKEISPNKAAEYKLQVKKYENANKTIDDVLEVLKRPAAAGLAGKSMRLEERIANILGQKDASRTQMMRDLQLLKMEAPTLLLGRSGRPLKAEESRIDDIVPGLSSGDVQANTIQGLLRLKENFSKLRSDYQSVLPGSAKVEIGMPEVKPDTQGWDAFPLK